MSKLVGMVEKKGYRYFDWNCENGDGYSRMATSEMIRRATSSKQKQDNKCFLKKKIIQEL